MKSITFPPVPGGHSEDFRWTGTRFESSGSQTRVLRYETGMSGWTDDLTRFHEETAGADHYIDIASRENAIRSLQRFLQNPTPVIMDVGCSSGLLLSAMRERFPDATVIGADYVAGPLEDLGRRHPEVPLVQFDLAACPLPDNFVDAVVALNVLEHIKDDVAAIHHLYRILKPGGIAVIEVPAGPKLYDLYDKELMHHRRYSLPELVSKFTNAGFQVRQSSHLGFFLYPPFAAVKMMNRRRKRVPDVQRKRIVAQNIKWFRNSGFMHRLMRLETELRQKIPLPVGIRCVLTGQKS
jgi:SAM-dependent methyltransferase